MSYRFLFVIALAAALAATVACHDKEKYVPMSPDHPNGLDPTTVLAVEANPTSVPADGVSRTRITAHIDRTATSRKTPTTAPTGDRPRCSSANKNSTGNSGGYRSISRRARRERRENIILCALCVKFLNGP